MLRGCKRERYDTTKSVLVPQISRIIRGFAGLIAMDEHDPRSEGGDDEKVFTDVTEYRAIAASQVILL